MRLLLMMMVLFLFGETGAASMSCWNGCKTQRYNIFACADKCGVRTKADQNSCLDFCAYTGKSEELCESYRKNVCKLGTKPMPPKPSRPSRPHEGRPSRPELCPDGSWHSVCRLCPDGTYRDTCDVHGGSQLCPDGSHQDSCGLCPDGKYGC